MVTIRMEGAGPAHNGVGVDAPGDRGDLFDVLFHEAEGPQVWNVDSPLR